MATTTKTAARTATKTTPKVARATSGAGSDPCVRFYLAPALHDRMNATLNALEQASDPEKHRDDLADLVAEMTQSGMDYYFLKALKSAKVGFVAEQSARLGMSGAVKVIASVSRTFIGRMDAAQLTVVCRHIRELTV